MKHYIKPDFDVTIYEVEDIITTSANAGEQVTVGPSDPNEGGDWFG